MAGLLDALNSDEGMQALGLLAAAGPSATPMSFGQRLFGAMQQDQARRTEAEDRKMRQQMQRLQMEQLLRQASRQKALEDLPGQFMQPGMKPETMDNRDVGQPGEAPIPKTQFDLGGYANELFRYDPQTALQLRASMQKDNKRTTLKPGETVFDESGKPLFGLPATPDKANDTADLKNWLAVKAQGYPHDFNTFLREQANLKAPKAPVVNMYNTDSAKAETDLRKEFADIPQVKRFNAALPAYKAIEDAASRNNPQSDINLVYGIAKLYDPESVVREGEYGTIAGSQSIPEKIKGYAQYLAGGGRLTEQTKQQLLVEARGRINSFKTEHDAARKTYEGIATRRKLDPQNVFITPSDLPKPPDSPMQTDIRRAAAEELRQRRLKGQ